MKEGEGAGRGGSKDNICVSPCLPNDNTQWNSHTDQYFSMYLLVFSSFRSIHGAGKSSFGGYQFFGMRKKTKQISTVDVNIRVDTKQLKCLSLAANSPCFVKHGKISNEFGVIFWKSTLEKNMTGILMG